MEYTGPSTLKALVEDTYDHISRNYERRNPRFVAGFPHCLSLVAELPSIGLLPYKQKGFDSQDDLNRFVDSHVNDGTKIMSVLRSKSQKERRKLVDRLGNHEKQLRRADIFNINPGRGEVFIGGTVYMGTEDAIFLNAYSGAHYLITRPVFTPEAWREQNDYFPGQIEHELVHNDLGDTLLCQLARKHYEMWANLKTALVLAYEAAKSEKISDWLDSPRGKELFASVSGYGVAFHPTEMARAAEHAWAEVVKYEKDIPLQLGIHSGQEALAYNFWGGKRRYMDLVAGTDEEKRQIGEMLFAYFTRLIEQSGKLAAIQIARKMSNFSAQKQTPFHSLIDA